MPTPDERRLLAHLASAGGAVVATANVDPQWNATTAERKHGQDLARALAADADLDADHEAVPDLLAALADRGLIERTTSAEGARVALTPAGREAV